MVSRQLRLRSAFILGVGYVAAGVIGWIVDITDGDGKDLFFWLLLLVGGGVLILAGLFVLTAASSLDRSHGHRRNCGRARACLVRHRADPCPPDLHRTPDHSSEAVRPSSGVAWNRVDDLSRIRVVELVRT
jgi:hypothetical protein